MHIRSLYLKCACFLLVVVNGCTLHRFGHAQEPGTTQFEITLDPKIASEPINGRLFVFISERSRRAPKSQIEWSSPEPFFAVDVRDFAPGDTRIVNGDAFGFPDRLPTLPAGNYYIHALLAHSKYDGDPGRAEGNFYSQAVQHYLEPNRQMVLELVLDQIVPRKTSRLQLWMEQIEVRCPLLGRFHGREHREPAIVIMPPSYSTHPERRFPVVYCIPSFDITHLHSRHWQQLTGPREAQEDEVEFIRVVLNGQGPWGHHSYANSAQMDREQILSSKSSCPTSTNTTARWRNQRCAS